jgi:hypothetical protein
MRTRSGEALQIVRSVLEGDYRLSPRLKALFLTRKARALAQGGDESALHLIPEIRSLFLDGVSDGDPVWAWWVDERELDWQEAMVQRDLGLASQAINKFERSVLAIPATETRSQYVHRAYLLLPSTWFPLGLDDWSDVTARHVRERAVTLLGWYSDSNAEVAHPAFSA